MRAISMAAGLAPNFVSQMIKIGQDPSTENLKAVCAELGVTVEYILDGADVTPEVKALAARISRLDERALHVIEAALERFEPQEK